LQQWYDEEFGPTGTLNGGAYADKSYWICTEANWDTLYQNPNQNYPVDELVYNKSGGFSNGYVPLFCVVGYQNKVYYNSNDGYVAGLDFRTALRLAINEMPQPPVMTVSESSFSPSCAPGASVADTFNIANSGAGPLNYSFSIDYDGVVAAGSTWHTNGFESGIVYTNTNWTTEIGGTWNGGTMCADAKDKATSVMTSAAFNTTGVGDRLWLEFKYGTSAQTGSSLKAEYYTGSAWQQVWYYTGSGVGTVKVELPVKSANTQLRFTAVSTFVSGNHSIERLDDIKVYSDDQAYRWIQFDQRNTWGEPTATGTIAAGNNQTFNVTFNATGLAAGTYTADIMIHTNYPPEIHKAVPVTFVVGSSPVIPAVPANITTSIVSGNVYINWDNSANATSYDVYSSADPYGTFSFLTNVTASEYTYTPGTNTKRFFYIVAKNATKESPKSIVVK
jgi:hypothetical protein